VNDAADAWQVSAVSTRAEFLNMFFFRMACFK